MANLYKAVLDSVPTAAIVVDKKLRGDNEYFIISQFLCQQFFSFFPFFAFI